MDVTTKQYVDSHTLNIENIIANTYNSSSVVYYSGDYIIHYDEINHADKLYKCNALSTTGNWDGTKWDEVQIASIIKSLDNGVVQNYGEIMGLKPRVQTLEGSVYNLNLTVNGDQSTTPATPGLVGDVSTLKTTVGDNSGGLVKRVGDLETNMPTITDTYSASSHDGMSGVAVASAIAQIPNNYQLVRYSELETGDGTTVNFDIFDSSGATDVEFDPAADLLDVYIAGLHKSTAHYTITQSALGQNHDYMITFNTAPGSGDEIELYWQRISGNTIVPSQGVGF